MTTGGVTGGVTGDVTGNRCQRRVGSVEVVVRVYFFSFHIQMRLLILASLLILLHMIKSEMNKSRSLEHAEIFFNDLPEMYKYNVDEVTRTMQGELDRRYANENIILRNIKSRKMQRQNDSKYYVSPLTGEKMLIEEFTHNNMKPYFGGRLKQNMDFEAHSTKLEAFTGISKNTCEKDAERCFSDIKSTAKDFDPMYVTQRSRMITPNAKNNVMPIDPVRVGPGYDPNNKFSSAPSGGLQQTDLAYASGMFKSVDELRSKTNPKVTYDGQILYGQKGSKRGEVKELPKNRVERFYEQDHEDLIKTTGAFTKDKMRPCFEEKPTKRQTAVQEYKGGAHQNSASNRQPAPKNSGPVKRSFLDSFGLRNLTNNDEKKHDDYGKKNIAIFTNGKDLTTVSARQGNISSLFKSMISPIQDVLQPTTKEFTIGAARSFPGNVNGPNKLTMYDPSGVARTTIKETLIHDETTGNLRVDAATVVYDPNDVARTTMKQTLDNHANDTNLKGNNKPRIKYVNPLDHTTRELTENSRRDGNVSSAMQHGDGYRNANFKSDPTNKEVTSDNDYYGMPENQDGDGYKSANVEVKSTQKQFLSDNEYTGIKGTDTSSKPESYEAILNSVINDVNEQLLEGRDPTSSSVKLTTGVQGIKTTKERDDCSLRAARDTANYQLSVEGPKKELLNVREFSKHSDVESALDVSVLDQLAENPYAIRI